MQECTSYRRPYSGWLKTKQHRGKRERRTAWSMRRELSAMDYRSGYGRVAAYARRWREAQTPQHHHRRTNRKTQGARPPDTANLSTSADTV